MTALDLCLSPLLNQCSLEQSESTEQAHDPHVLMSEHDYVTVHTPGVIPSDLGLEEPAAKMDDAVVSFLAALTIRTFFHPRATAELLTFHMLLGPSMESSRALRKVKENSYIVLIFFCSSTLSAS